MVTMKPKVFTKAGKQRFGKGFSRGELGKSGLSPKDALRFGIPLDSKRKTAHEENVKDLRAFLQEKQVALKPKKSKRKPKS